MSDAVVFGSQSAQRIVGAVQWVERNRQRLDVRGVASLSIPRDSNVQFVKVTSLTPSGPARYPGKRLEYDSTDNTWSEDADVWVVAAGGEVPELDTPYEAVQVGHEDDRFVFAYEHVDISSSNSITVTQGAEVITGVTNLDISGTGVLADPWVLTEPSSGHALLTLRAASATVGGAITLSEQFVGLGVKWFEYVGVWGTGPVFAHWLVDADGLKIYGGTPSSPTGVNVYLSANQLHFATSGARFFYVSDSSGHELRRVNGGTTHHIYICYHRSVLTSGSFSVDDGSVIHSRGRVVAGTKFCVGNDYASTDDGATGTLADGSEVVGGIITDIGSSLAVADNDTAGIVSLTDQELGSGVKSVDGIVSHTTFVGDAYEGYELGIVENEYVYCRTVVSVAPPDGYWLFDETSGTTFADSSGSNDLSGDSSPSSDFPSVLAGGDEHSIEFDGVDDFIEGSAYNITDNFSVAFWANPASTSQYGYMVTNGRNDISAANGWGVGIGNAGGAGNKLIFNACGYGAEVDTGYTFSAADTWYHIAVVCESGTIKFYVDGVQTVNTVGNGMNAPPTGFFVGGHDGARYFAGKIDDLRFYNLVLTEEQIALLVSGGDPAVPIYGGWSYDVVDGNFRLILAGAAYEVVDADDVVQTGVTGTIGVGAQVVGGIVVDAGSSGLAVRDLSDVVDLDPFDDTVEEFNASRYHLFVHRPQDEEAEPAEPTDGVYGHVEFPPAPTDTLLIAGTGVGFKNLLQIGAERKNGILLNEQALFGYEDDDVPGIEGTYFRHHRAELRELLAQGDVGLCQGRLSLVTNDPIPGALGSSISTLYFTPHNGNRLDLYKDNVRLGDDGTFRRWTRIQFAEISISAGSGLHDVYIYCDNDTEENEVDGDVHLYLEAWTDLNTRAVALAYQDGIPVHGTYPTHRYLGVVYNADNTSKCGVLNYYNRSPRILTNTIYQDDDKLYETEDWAQWGSNAGTVGYGTLVLLSHGIDAEEVRANARCVTSDVGGKLRVRQSNGAGSSWSDGRHITELIGASATIRDTNQLIQVDTFLDAFDLLAGVNILSPWYYGAEDLIFHEFKQSVVVQY